MPLTTYSPGDVLTASSLNANLIFAASSPAAKLGQVVTATKANAFSTSSAAYIDVTDLSLSITPTVNTSKVLVMVTLQGSCSIADGLFRLVRDSTAIAVGTAGSSENGFTQVNANASFAMFTGGLVFVDSPATTSATTYKIQGIVVGGSTLFVNRRATNAVYGGFSTITAIEVLA